MAKLDVVTTENVEQFNLGDKEIYDQVAFVVDFVTESYASGESYRFLQKLERALNKSNLIDEILEKYQRLLTRLRFIALPMLDLPVLVDLFRINFLYALQTQIDLKDRVRRLFPESVGREDLNTKSALTQAIEANEQKIGSVSISEWIKNYKRTLNDKTQPGTLEIIRFITENKSASSLDGSSKELLKGVLSFYDWLKYKSIDVAAVLRINKEPTPPKSLDIRSQAPNVIPTFSPPAPQPAPAAPPLAKEQTAFEKKLAQVSTEHGEDLESLKRRLEETKTPEVSKPIVPKPTTLTKPVPNPVVEEIQRELKTPELPKHETVEIQTAPPPSPPRKEEEIKKAVTTKPWQVVESKPVGKLVTQINTMDDLKNIGVSYLRQGPLQKQTEQIKSKIFNLAKQNNVLLFYAVNSFEQSPLFKAYLSSGYAMVEGSGAAGELTQEEFEAIADLKKEIERL